MHGAFLINKKHICSYFLSLDFKGLIMPLICTTPANLFLPFELDQQAENLAFLEMF